MVELKDEDGRVALIMDKEEVPVAVEFARPRRELIRRAVTQPHSSFFLQQDDAEESPSAVLAATPSAGRAATSGQRDGVVAGA